MKTKVTAGLPLYVDVNKQLVLLTLNFSILLPFYIHKDGLYTKYTHTDSGFSRLHRHSFSAIAGPNGRGQAVADIGDITGAPGL